MTRERQEQVPRRHLAGISISLHSLEQSCISFDWMDRLRVEDVHFKERIFSTWCNFVHFRRASTARGNVLARPSRPFSGSLLSGRHLFIHLTTLSGTTTALTLCPWPACPTVHLSNPIPAGEQTNRPTDRQSCLRWHFLQAAFFAQLLIIRSEIYFILSDSSRHLAFWNEFRFFFLSSRLVAAWLPLGVVVIFNSISFSHLSQLALPNSLPVYNCRSSLVPYPLAAAPSGLANLCSFNLTPHLFTFFSVCYFHSVLTSTLITLLHAGLPLRSRIYFIFYSPGWHCVYATLNAFALSNVIMLSVPGVQASPSASA